MVFDPLMFGGSKRLHVLIRKFVQTFETTRWLCVIQLVKKISSINELSTELAMISHIKITKLQGVLVN